MWNVLAGDMTLIGPRPERPEFVEALAARIPFYKARHAVRPGLTGWAAVKMGYAASEKDALRKLQYDLYYIKHKSPVLDLTIALSTVARVAGLRGR
jgi:lipopolysaccharide/colanic/teichoic acid biosynthesis glycosyltransferase